MARNSFQQGWNDFLSYVAFFGFVAIVAFGGWWVWRTMQQKQPSTVAAAESDHAPAFTPSHPGVQRPSEMIKSLMEGNLPPLFQPFVPEEQVLSPDFAATEALLAKNSVTSGPWQAAWVAGKNLCREIRETNQLRNQMVSNQIANRPAATPSGTAPLSAAELKQAKAREEFFARASEKRWEEIIRQKKPRIEALYRQLLSTEAKIKS